MAGRGAQVGHRVLQRRRPLGPRGDALEAEAPQQGVVGGDARAVGEADGAARDPRRGVLGAGRLRAGHQRGETGLEPGGLGDHAVLEDLQPRRGTRRGRTTAKSCT